MIKKCSCQAKLEIQFHKMDLRVLTDWHMRVNCDNYEEERDIRRGILSDQMVERLTRRILWVG